MSVLALLLDGAMIAMLAATIYYAVTLKKRLGVLHSEGAAMQARLDDFTRAADRAEQSLAALKALPASAGRSPAPIMSPAQIERANSVRDELIFLIEAGDKVASHLKNLEKSVSRKVFSTVPPAANASTLRKAAGGAQRPAAGAVPKANGTSILRDPGLREPVVGEPVLRATA